MVEDEAVRNAASVGSSPDADIVSAWQADFDRQKAGTGADDAVLLDLPSGKQLKAIRMPLILLMQQNAIPDRLTHIVSDFMSAIEGSGGDAAKAQAGLEATFAENQLKAAQTWIELLNFVFVNCALTPRFVMDETEADPAQGTFWVGRVNFYDKLWLFQWAQGVDRSIHEFLQEQVDAVGTVFDEQGVRVTPEQLLVTGEFRNIMVGMADRSGDVDVGPLYPGEDRRNDRGADAQEQETADASGAEVQAEADYADAAGAVGVVTGTRRRTRRR